MNWNIEAEKIVEEAESVGEFSDTPHETESGVMLDLVSIGFNADTGEFYVADNGDIELETSNVREFLNNFPKTMRRLEKEYK